MDAWEIALMVSAIVIMVSGVQLISSMRDRRGRLMRNIQIISGAYLGAFLLGHITNIVLADRIWTGMNVTFQVATTKAPLGMLSNPNQPRLFVAR